MDRDRAQTWDQPASGVPLTKACALGEGATRRASRGSTARKARRRPSPELTIDLPEGGPLGASRGPAARKARRRPLAELACGFSVPV